MSASPPLTRDHLEIEKLSLEIALLRRQLDDARFGKKLGSAFVSNWMPSLIAAIVLFTLVPYANFLSWKNQKTIEIRNVHLTKRMDIYSDFTSNSTRVAQLIVYLNDAYELQRGNKSKIGFDMPKREVAPRLAKLQDERRDVEPRFVKSLRDVELYFGRDSAQEVQGIRVLYNNVKEPPGEGFVISFLTQRDKLAALMADEIR